ncbi:hypothetical protein DW355_00520 [Hylemonella gracilis]|uniref:Uncharacterized protein n=1 Tax=Hylemonella gracilis TaxID=80880 RepID=A0A4P6UHJ0_9BURK|nr:hypothetical protein [Hylemonella gracilis]QBK03455.1 hypothetical protein DW355_00520 [Hylemonella gracilis]
MPALNDSPSDKDPEKARLVRQILQPQDNFYNLALAASYVTAEAKKNFEAVKAKRDAEIAQLMARPLPELQAMRAAQMAKAKASEAAQAEAARRRQADLAEKESQKEAAKFYNQPSANADFGYWATMDFWTFDEALALLLGKDPRVLTRAAVKSELTAEFSLLALSKPQRPKSEFLRRYEDLRNVAERASAMKPAQLRPVDVVIWAGRSGAIAPPNELVQALAARVKRSQPQAPDLETAASLPTKSAKTSPVVETPLANPTPTLLKRAALVQQHQRAWPTIEADLRHANENGLSECAKAEEFGYWLEEPALEWARTHGKLTVSATATTALPSIVHRMGR